MDSEEEERETWRGWRGENSAYPHSSRERGGRRAYDDGDSGEEEIEKKHGRRERSAYPLREELSGYEADSKEEGRERKRGRRPEGSSYPHSVREHDARIANAAGREREVYERLHGREGSAYPHSARQLQDGRRAFEVDSEEEEEREERLKRARRGDGLRRTESELGTGRDRSAERGFLRPQDVSPYDSYEGVSLSLSLSLSLRVRARKRVVCDSPRRFL